jgi:hypothetical protein
LQRFPNDTVILDGYSELLISLGEIDKAKEVTLALANINISFWNAPSN